MPGRRGRPCSSTATSSPIRPGWSISSAPKAAAAKVKDNKIVLVRDWARDSDKIKGAFAIAQALARHAAKAAA